MADKSLDDICEELKKQNKNIQRKNSIDNSQWARLQTVLLNMQTLLFSVNNVLSTSAIAKNSDSPLETLIKEQTKVTQEATPAEVISPARPISSENVNDMKIARVESLTVFIPKTVHFNIDDIMPFKEISKPSKKDKDKDSDKDKKALTLFQQIWKKMSGKGISKEEQELIEREKQARAEQKEKAREGGSKEEQETAQLSAQRSSRGHNQQHL